MGERMRLDLAPGAALLVGDALETLKRLPDGRFQTCVTSPPYWGLRDYGVVGQLGLEASPEEYVSALVAVFREVRRVLRDDGTLWLNIGDAYYSYRTHLNGGMPGQTLHAGRQNGKPLSGCPRRANKHPGFKSKDLFGLPWMTAFALRADGWFLRAEVVWSKPHPTPERVKDRPVRAHESVFLLTKRPAYFYAEEAAGDLSVWSIPTSRGGKSHFATMPPELARRCIVAGSRLGDVVLDPFSGAGTTGLVATQNGRRYVGIELNPEYAELTRQRFAESAGVT